MKKYLIILTLLFILPFTVFADSYITNSVAGSATNCLYAKLNINDTISVINFESVDNINITGVDISKNRDNSVIAKVDYVNDLLTIQFKGKIILPEDSSFLFMGFDTVEEINGLEYLDTSNISNLYGFFGNCKSLLNLDLSSWDTSNVTSMLAMFFGCENLITLDVSNFVTSNVTTMQSMFYGLKKVTYLDVSNFDTKNVTNLNGLFGDCASLTSIDVSNFITNNVENFGSMFSGCKLLKNIDVSNFDTKKATFMGSMFDNCESLTSIDVSNFDTHDVTHMACMFENCFSLTSLDLSNFNTSNVLSFGGMFYGLKNVKHIDGLEHFDTSKCIQFDLMFGYCDSLEYLDLSSFDISSATSLLAMFIKDFNLTTIYVNNNWDASNVGTTTLMFSGCSLLVGGNGLTYDSNKISGTYANYEDGYLTLAPTVTVKDNLSLFGTIIKITKNIFSNVKELFSSNNDWDHNDNDIINTGETVSIMSDDNIFRTYIISYNGDTNGDGEINYIDYVRVYNHINNNKLLNKEYLISADYNNDNVVDNSDYSKIYSDIKR